MKMAIVVSVVAFILASVVAWQHFRDAKLRHEVVGSWHCADSYVMRISPDGSFLAGSSPSHDSISGTWQIKDGDFIATTTKLATQGGTALNGGHVRLIVRFRIVHLDVNQFVYQRIGDMSATSFTRI